MHQMKPGQVDWQKLVFKEKMILFQRTLEFPIEYQTVMRSLHAFMKEEYGQRSIFLLQLWECSGKEDG